MDNVKIVWRDVYICRIAPITGLWTVVGKIWELYRDGYNVKRIKHAIVNGEKYHGYYWDYKYDNKDMDSDIADFITMMDDLEDQWELKLLEGDI